MEEKDFTKGMKEYDECMYSEGLDEQSVINTTNEMQSGVTMRPPKRQ